MEKAHIGHFGINRTVLRAKEILYWPNMEEDLENLVSRCRICEKFSISNRKEPLIQHKVPNYPFQKLGADFCNFGIPEEVMSDNIPFNALVYRQFSQEYSFKITTSSPIYPKSNGMSERNVQTAKNILPVSEKFLQNSNTKETQEWKNKK